MLKRSIRTKKTMPASLMLAILLVTMTTRADDFTIVGPGGGGAMYNATINPNDVSEALVSCDMTGSYIIYAGGHSWRIFNLRGSVHFFSFDPLLPHTIYAGTEGLWRSTNDGESWALIWPKPATIRGIRMSSDHADETLVSDHNPMGEVVTLAIDPDESHALVAGTVKEGASAVFLSKDDGGTWDKAHDLPGTPQRIWIDPHSSKSARDIYVAGKWGVTVRHNGKWQDRPAPGNVVFTAVSAGFSAAQGIVLYATSDAGIFLSRDGGISWISAPLPGDG